MGTKEKVLAALADREVSATPETKVEDLELDSLEFMELMVSLDIPDEKIAGLQTVQDIIEAVP